MAKSRKVTSRPKVISEAPTGHYSHLLADFINGLPKDVKLISAEEFAKMDLSKAKR